jgi:hypothetical protein
LGHASASLSLNASRQTSKAFLKPQAWPTIDLSVGLLHYLIVATKLLCPKLYAPRAVTLEHQSPDERCGETPPRVGVSPSMRALLKLPVPWRSIVSSWRGLEGVVNETNGLGISSVTDTRQSWAFKLPRYLLLGVIVICQKSLVGKSGAITHRLRSPELVLWSTSISWGTRHACTVP